MFSHCCRIFVAFGKISLGQLSFVLTGAGKAVLFLWACMKFVSVLRNVLVMSVIHHDVRQCCSFFKLFLLNDLIDRLLSCT